MKRFGKKPYSYFNNFVECSELALESAMYLCDALKKFDPAQVTKHTEAMRKLENKADSKKHEMHEHLAHEFMTPIEREDIVAIAQQMDNVIDSLEDVMLCIYMFDIQSIRPDALLTIEMVVHCCESTVKLVKEFEHFKKSKTICDFIIEVNSIESDGDKLYMDSMRRLFTEEGDLRKIIAWKTMYQYLEACLDACEDVADSIESVMMKNS